tara:strand:- start:594 stop:782 length:189 start_codon:yes stop_codon:yes gene_type:complete
MWDYYDIKKAKSSDLTDSQKKTLEEVQAAIKKLSRELSKIKSIVRKLPKHQRKLFRFTPEEE